MAGAVGGLGSEHGAVDPARRRRDAAGTQPLSLHRTADPRGRPAGTRRWPPSLAALGRPRRAPEAFPASDLPVWVGVASPLAGAEESMIFVHRLADRGCWPTTCGARSPRRARRPARRYLGWATTSVNTDGLARGRNFITSSRAGLQPRRHRGRELARSGPPRVAAAAADPARRWPTPETRKDLAASCGPSSRASQTALIRPAAGWRGRPGVVTGQVVQMERDSDSGGNPRSGARTPPESGRRGRQLGYTSGRGSSRICFPARPLVRLAESGAPGRGNWRSRLPRSATKSDRSCPAAAFSPRGVAPGGRTLEDADSGRDDFGPHLVQLFVPPLSVTPSGAGTRPPQLDDQPPSEMPWPWPNIGRRGSSS